jgi:starch synthase
MPSTFEPCGLNQMYSQAYGTPPIVHAVGGLADSVSDAETGYVFHAPTADAFLEAVTRARQAYIDTDTDTARWQRVQRNAMALDHGWGRSARLYEEVYRSAMANA